MRNLGSQPDVGVAQRWHFASVVIFLLAVGAATLLSQVTGHSRTLEFQPGQRLPVYLRLAVMEWLVFAYVVFGVHRKGVTASTIIDACPASLRRWISSFAFGIGAAVLWIVIATTIIGALHPTTHELRAVQSFLPSGIIERLGFAVLTLTAGFCEEFIYRGYLQRQFRAWTGSLTLAIVLQAGLFALLHVALPWKFVVSVTAMALFLGVVVGWRKTLVPAMLVHTVVNLVGGLLSSTGTRL